MKKNVYLAAALLTVSGIGYMGCSEDEKIVEIEVEKIVVEKDYTKLSDLEREGIKGNPKTITEWFSYSAIEDKGEVKPGAWSTKTVYTFSAAGYIEKEEHFESLFTKLEKDMPDDPNDTWYKQTTPVLTVVSVTTVTRGTDNRPTGITEEGNIYRLTVTDTEGNSMMFEPADSDSFDFTWYFGGTPASAVLTETARTKGVTTFDVTLKKATKIEQLKNLSNPNWTDSKKVVYDLDAFGMPNEESRLEYNYVEPSSSMKTTGNIITRAFDANPSAEYVESLDGEGNWIIRYYISDSGSSYTKRDIVYY